MPVIEIFVLVELVVVAMLVDRFFVLVGIVVVENIELDLFVFTTLVDRLVVVAKSYCIGSIFFNFVAHVVYFEGP